MQRRPTELQICFLSANAVCMRYNSVTAYSGYQEMQHAQSSTRSTQANGEDSVPAEACLGVPTQSRGVWPPPGPIATAQSELGRFAVKQHL